MNLKQNQYGIYECYTNIINLTNKNITFEKRLKIVKHIYVTERNTTNTIVYDLLQTSMNEVKSKKNPKSVLNMTINSSEEDVSENCNCHPGNNSSTTTNKTEGKFEWASCSLCDAINIVIAGNAKVGKVDEPSVSNYTDEQREIIEKFKLDKTFLTSS